MIPSWYLGVVHLNEEEVVILGGRGSDDQHLFCVHIFNTKTDTIRRVAEEND